MLERPHGTRARYIAKCRCPLCREAQLAYCRDYYRARKRLGEGLLVPAELARQHLRELQRMGVGVRALEMEGIPHGTLMRILSGECKRIRRSTERRILAVQADYARHGYVDATLTRERLRAIMALGFTGRWIAERLELARPVRYGENERIKRPSAHRVAELTRKVAIVYRKTGGDLVGPSRENRRRFARVEFDWYGHDFDVVC
jgi:hypothetical protein